MINSKPRMVYYLASWLAHWISIASHYTCVWSQKENKYGKCRLFYFKFFVGITKLRRKLQKACRLTIAVTGCLPCP